MKIVLSGYMGSGKSGVGKRVANKLKLPFLDLDEEIVRREQREISEIFNKRGEIYFRRKESEVLEDRINSNEDFVLSLGGGTPCYANNLEMMNDKKDVKLVYLKTSLEQLKSRLFKERSSRPLISHLETPEVLEDFIRKHLFERTYYYNQCELIVETDGKDMNEVAEEIIASLD